MASCPFLCLNRIKNAASFYAIAAFPSCCISLRLLRVREVPSVSRALPEERGAFGDLRRISNDFPCFRPLPLKLDGEGLQRFRVASSGRPGTRSGDPTPGGGCVLSFVLPPFVCWGGMPATFAAVGHCVSTVNEVERPARVIGFSPFVP